MNIRGIDTAATVTAKAASILKAEEYAFVGRYLSKTSGVNAWKVLKADEAMRIHNAGLAILLIWETAAARAKGGSPAGAEDGTAARALAEALGVPDGTIYFTVDYNAPAADYDAVEAYLRAARAAVSPYSAGVYGSRAVCDAMSERGAVRYFMQCVAWSNGMGNACDVYQYQGQDGPAAKALASRLDFKVDLCVTYDCRSAGMWMPNYNEYPDEDGGTIIEPAAGSAQTKPPWWTDDMAWAKEEGLILDGRGDDPVTRGELSRVLRRDDARIDAKLDERDKALLQAVEKLLTAYFPEDNKKDSGLLSD